jgi:hypothetical protein
MVATASHHSLSGRILRFVLPLVLALVASALAVPSVSAGEEAPLIDFRVSKLDCAEDPGDFAEGTVPEGCSPVEGVSFTIEVEGGETLECTTNADGRCIVQVPSESYVTVTEDTSTGTEGYTPMENPIETQAVSEFAGARFINLPVDEPSPTEAPTTGLPDTGASPQPDSTPFTGILLAVATLLGLGGCLLVTRPVRQ